MATSKICKWCSTEKDISCFHLHKGMADGRLNKCSSCVLESVKSWRKKNPSYRKEEHNKNREKFGWMTREEYLRKKKLDAKGRRISSKEYAARRRLRVEVPLTEFDSFVITEAFRLADLRKLSLGSNWHVDHIVPLFHKEACGLHNSSNLQVVPAKWNVDKRNNNMNNFFNITGY